jgi:hypothetical protein
MRTLLVMAVLALGCGVQLAAAGAPADGKWLIVYAEEGGRRNNAWEQRQATMSGGTLSYEAEGGKKLSLKLKFGPHQAIEATVSAGGGAGAGIMRRGVYIMGQDYLCISLEKAGKAGAGGAGVKGELEVQKATASAGEGQQSSGDFILILRRQRGGKKP